MGRIGRIVAALGAIKDSAGAWTRSFRIDTGGGYSFTAPQGGPAGDDSAPLDSDKVLLISLPRSGAHAIVGYVDTKNQPTAGKGEKHLYSRDASGQIKAELWLYSSGLVRVQNSGGFIQISPSGTISLNGVEISPGGTITAPGEIKGHGVVDLITDVTLNTHEHPGSNTPPTPGT